MHENLAALRSTHAAIYALFFFFFQDGVHKAGSRSERAKGDGIFFLLLAEEMNAKCDWTTRPTPMTRRLQFLSL